MLNEVLLKLLSLVVADRANECAKLRVNLDVVGSRIAWLLPFMNTFAVVLIACDLYHVVAPRQEGIGMICRPIFLLEFFRSSSSMRAS